MPSCGSGSVLGASLSLAVTTMGAGILTLPAAYYEGGVIPSTVLLLFVAVLTVYSVDFIILGVEKLGLNSYEELTLELLGKRSLEVVRWILIFYNFGSAIGYLVILSDVFEPIQPSIALYVWPALSTPKHVLTLFWFVVVLPLSCVPKIGSLHFTSFLAIFATSVISLLVVLRYFFPGPTQLQQETLRQQALLNNNNNNNNNKVGSPTSPGANLINNNSGGVLWWKGAQPLLALPIIMFSFDCQSLVFQIYAGLEDMRRRTMMKVSIISLTVTTVIHAAVGFFGYLANPLDVRGNIISNYDPRIDMLFAFGYAIYAVPITLAFVLMLFPIRDSLFILWYGFSSASVATHVPRRRDYRRLVQEEERLEKLAKLEERSLACSANVSFARGGAGTGGGGGAHHQHDNLGSSDNKLCGFGGHSFVSNTSMVSNARTELESVVAAKHGTNTVEVISPRDHLIVSVALSTSCLFFALLLPGILSLVALLGGLCSATLCFVAPALYRLQLHRRGIGRLEGAVEWTALIVLLAFGVVGGTLGTVVAVRETFFS